MVEGKHVGCLGPVFPVWEGTDLGEAHDPPPANVRRACLSIKLRERDACTISILPLSRSSLIGWKALQDGAAAAMRNYPHGSVPEHPQDGTDETHPDEGRGNVFSRVQKNPESIAPSSADHVPQRGNCPEYKNAASSCESFTSYLSLSSNSFSLLLKTSSPPASISEHTFALQVPASA